MRVRGPGVKLRGLSSCSRPDTARAVGSCRSFLPQRYHDRVTTADSPKDRAGNANRSRAKQAMNQAADEAQDIAAAGLDKISDDKISEIQKRWENRLAWPVLIAAFLSVPAVFLTLFDGAWEVTGSILLYVTTAVLIFETAVFFSSRPRRSIGCAATGG